MREAGTRLIQDISDLSAMGFAEVALRIPFYWGLERRLRRLIDRSAFDLLVPVDFPGLNIRIARHAARRGIPVVYYIGPQVWAWRPRRARELSRIASRIAVILPFEERIYSDSGGRAEFVGHPLLDDEPRPDPQALRRSLGLDAAQPVLALFPGSRRQELEAHARPFIAIANHLERRVEGLNVVVSRAPSLPGSLYRSFPFRVTRDSASLRALATAGLVKSGTGTLEAALAGMPFAVAYITHPLTHAIARRLVKVPFISLANLVVGERIVDEFLQSEVTPARVVPALEPLLDPGSSARRSVVAALGRVRSALGSPGAARRVVDLAQDALVTRSARESVGA